MNTDPTIIYTLTDEAPLLATYAFLPVIRTFTAPAGVRVETSDLSVAARILGTFPECLTPEQPRCPHIVPGTPALAYLDDAVYRLERDRVVRIHARCPLDPQIGLRQEPVRAFGDFMLCEMLPLNAYDENQSLTVPAAVLVSLADGSQHAPRGLGRDTTFARGHWYHSVPGGIARRRAVDAPDELLVHIDGRDGFDTMAVDDETLVWTKRGSMWSAPLD